MSNPHVIPQLQWHINWNCIPSIYPHCYNDIFVPQKWDESNLMVSLRVQHIRTFSERKKTQWLVQIYFKKHCYRNYSEEYSIHRLASWRNNSLYDRPLLPNSPQHSRSTFLVIYIYQCLTLGRTHKPDSEFLSWNIETNVCEQKY